MKTRKDIAPSVLQIKYYQIRTQGISSEGIQRLTVSNKLSGHKHRAYTAEILMSIFLCNLWFGLHHLTRVSSEQI